MVRKRHSGFDDDLEFVEQTYLPALHVREARPEVLHPTGLLGPTGKPIFRYYPPSNPIGFLADIDEDADGESYGYVEGHADEAPDDPAL